MKASAALSIALAAILLAACGGRSQSWKQEFTASVKQVIESAEQVGEVTRSATGPADLAGPFARFHRELLPAEEKLEEFEFAPSASCSAAERRALGSVRRLELLSRESTEPKDYTPALLENAKVDPRKAVKRLEKDLSSARC